MVHMTGAGPEPTPLLQRLTELQPVTSDMIQTDCKVTLERGHCGMVLFWG